MRQIKIEKKITNRDSESLARYLKEVSEIKLLTFEEETALARKIKRGDTAALDTLVKANLRFVVSIAKQYQSRDGQLEDLINEGNIGLIKAAERFDDTKGFKFISFAVWWIRQSIMQYIKDHGKNIRLPANRHAALGKIEREIDRFMKIHEREPSSDELSEILEVSTESVEALLPFRNRSLSLDAPYGDEEHNKTLENFLASSDQSPDTAISQIYHQEQIMRIFQKVLRDNEIIVLTAFYGFNGAEPQTLEKIGKALGYSQGRIRQIKDKGVQKFSIYFQKSKQRGFV